MRDLYAQPPKIESQKFRSELDGILDRPLRPESIDHYAEGALEDLVLLVQDCIWTFDQVSTENFDTPREMEAAAFTYFGLGEIEPILDHIAQKAEEIRMLDGVIAGAHVLDTVITPPDPSDTVIGGDQKPFELNRIVPKLKTLLFVLLSDFNVDVGDPNQLALSTGVINPDIFRRTSYALVEVTQPARTILICDEIGNVTYVFNSDKMGGLGLTGEDLVRLTKNQLSALLAGNPELGQKLRYSKHFAGTISAAIENPEAEIDPTVVQNREKSYLYPPAPEGFVTQNGLASLLGVSFRPIERSIQNLGDALGSVGTYKFGSNTTRGLSPKQQEMIRADLGAAGTLKEQAPEGYLSARGIAEQLGIAAATVRKSAERLGDMLGEAETYRFGANKTPGYSPKQQAKIRAELDARGVLSEQAPVGHLSAQNVALQLGVSRDLVKLSADNLSESLGEVGQYRVGHRVTQCYSLGQQAMIRADLETRGLIVDLAPEDVLSIMGIAKALGVKHPKVADAVRSLGEELGEVRNYKFGSKITAGYLPVQRAKIEQFLQKS